MSTENHSKINYLLQSQPYGTVFLSSWLAMEGYSPDLQKRYRNSGWLESVGTGAMKRFGDAVTVDGAIFALQNQLKLSVHIGAKSALARLGKSHYLEMGDSELLLFGSADEKLPKWFFDYNWGVKIKYNASGFLPDNLAIEEIEVKNLTVKISSPIRAIFECLYLAPQEQSLMECYELLEGMGNIRPATVQELLETCSSVKVKRLFLFMAESAGHSWLKHVDMKKVNLGSGKRSIVPQGIYVPKYQITVPKELMGNGEDI
ncbi:type IV toxin-antitoxin system AbiEi family antitoxin [Pedobacter borealis]|uniref:type IV toxin-antitoxin system AbiEi family antitoxin n=1 Tax=Pedobacter borealis TaxID=475254 RepID=UPI000492EEB1|nr:type IV toxin-antitoxin system AbiEi family antitoxin [Pedobacter borealis]